MIVGRERSAKNIRTGIAKILNDNRIGIIGEIPSSKHESVRLFDLDLPSGQLYEALQIPGNEQDERLRELIDHDSRQKLDKIRAILLT
jgi:hypothetical protein